MGPGEVHEVKEMCDATCVKTHSKIQAISPILKQWRKLRCLFYEYFVCLKFMQILCYVTTHICFIVAKEHTISQRVH